MNLRLDTSTIIRFEFKKILKWFEEEFEILFGFMDQHPNKEQFMLANEILDQFSKMVNEYRDADLLFELVNSLDTIEKKFPLLFTLQ
ncbi:MAG: hypothetical protein EU533_07895 [Promethearchaeota archaeon]|nr:MAG: hypothetical protein EU533_07895 [Candidatus Lokiarchaeota archaeon]